LASTLGLAEPSAPLAARYVDAVVVGLNWLYGIRPISFALGSVTTAQREAHTVLARAAASLHRRLPEAIDQMSRSLEDSLAGKDS
jgi:hypothetical protein